MFGFPYKMKPRLWIFVAVSIKKAEIRAVVDLFILVQFMIRIHYYILGSYLIITYNIIERQNYYSNNNNYYSFIILVN